MRDSAFEDFCRPGARHQWRKAPVYTAFAALCDPGDEVICPAPYWTTYPEAIVLAGGVPVVIDTDDTAGFKVTVAQLEAARTPRTKCCYL